MKKKVIIVDYGLGNIRSVQKSIQKTFKENNDFDSIVERSNNYKSLIQASHIVLPGQGAFESCMNGLKRLDGMIDELRNQVLIKNKNILGICVGMQLFADIGFENGKHEGLGWIEGRVVKLPDKCILPHMGWNEIKASTNNTRNHKEPSFHPMLNQIYNEHFYFVHSYYFEPKNKNNIIATTYYGMEIPVFVCKNNIFGVQFHPEKSSRAGIKFLLNFLSRC